MNCNVSEKKNDFSFNFLDNFVWTVIWIPHLFWDLNFTMMKSWRNKKSDFRRKYPDKNRSISDSLFTKSSFKQLRRSGN